MVVEIKEIVDQGSLRAYLREQSVEVSQAVAVHAALMVFPKIAHELPHIDVEAVVLGVPKISAISAFFSLHTSWTKLCWPNYRIPIFARFGAISPAASNAIGFAALTTISYTDFKFSEKPRDALNVPDSAAAAVAAADDAMDVDVWKPLKKALGVIGSGSEVVVLPLWAGSVPNEIAQDWQNLQMRLLADDPNWTYWLNWYEARIRGEVAEDEELHIRVAQIDNEDWELGAAHVNRLIAGYVKEYEALKPKAKPKDIQDALDNVVLRAALADFEYRDLDKLMKMIPFPDDLRDLEDEQLKKDIAELLDLLRQKSARFLDEVTSKQVDAGFRQDLKDYVAEVSRPLADMRPRFLHFTGGDLNGSSLDDFITDALGERLSTRLERLVDQHYDLMRLYFAAALGRLGALDQVEITAGASPADVTVAIRGSLDVLWAVEGNPLPQLDLADQAVLESRFEELQLLGQSLAHPDEKVAGRRLASFRKKAAALSVTIVRLALKSGQVAWKVTKVGAVVGAATTTNAAALHSIFPAETLAAINALVRVLSNIPWPF